MTADELKSIPKGQFIVMKTGTRPMRTRLRLFLEWGITFGEPYKTPERARRRIWYASREELERNIRTRGRTAPQEEAPARKDEKAPGPYNGVGGRGQKEADQ